MSGNLKVCTRVCAFYPIFLMITLMSSLVAPDDDELSPSLHIRTDPVNTDTLSDENLMMAGIGRNM